LAVAFAGLALLVVSPKPGSAFTNGQYNLIRIQACVSDPAGDEDFLVVYDSITGGALVMADALAILSILPICHPGGAFYAFLNNGAVTNVAVVPGLQ
jgi:hypothetical protein